MILPSVPESKPPVTTALIELHHLPCIAYFSALADCQEIVVEKYEHYVKQTYRNRCLIRGAHQVETLVVPVKSCRDAREVTAVRIAQDQKWLNHHWRTIQSAYGKAPFFEYYAPELHDIFYRKHIFLYDLNLDIMTLCLKWLKSEAAVRETDSYEKKAPAGVLDVRGAINPKKEDGCNKFYKSIEYPQVFGSKFVPNLSLIDLVFNQGPGSRAIVKASVQK